MKQITSKLSRFKDKNSEEAWLAILTQSPSEGSGRCPLGQLSLEDPTGDRGTTSKVVHSQSWQVSAVRKPQVLSAWSRPRAIEWPHSMEASSSRGSSKRPGRSCNAVYNLPLEVTHCPSCGILCSMWVSLTHMGDAIWHEAHGDRQSLALNPEPDAVMGWGLWSGGCRGCLRGRDESILHMEEYELWPSSGLNRIDGHMYIFIPPHRLFIQRTDLPSLGGGVYVLFPWTEGIEKGGDHCPNHWGRGCGQSNTM